MQNPAINLLITPLSIPADTDIVCLFDFYADSPWAMLLDSSNSAHKNARFDILAANPLFSVTSKDGITVIEDHVLGSEQASNGDPISILEDLYNQILPLPQRQKINLEDNSELPFKAGLLGYFSYDLGKRFEKFSKTSKADYTSSDMAVGFYTWSIIKDNKEGKFYRCELTGLKSQVPQEKELLERLKQGYKDQPFSLTSAWQANMDENSYRQKINKIHQYLYAGDCYQVNLAQRFHARYQGSEWQAYKQLRHANQAPFSAFIRLPETCYLSISPERFLSVRERVVESKPIKGTRPRHSDAQLDEKNRRDLLDSEKDKAENLMIADLLRNDMSKTCEPGSINVPELFHIESFAAVHHLVTTIRGKLKEHLSPLSLLRNAFPGGSITGAPKIRAMQVIDELEPHKRNIYCGSIGYLGVQEDMDSNICIRTLLCEQENIYCWAGGGIVLDSKPEEEYQESLDKVSKILPVLSREND